MRPLRSGLVLAVTLSVAAVGFVLAREASSAENERAWTVLDRSRRAPNPIEAIESAHDLCASTSAAPWSALELALALYRSGKLSDLERALQVAGGVSEEQPGHPARVLGRRLEEVVGTYVKP